MSLPEGPREEPPRNKTMAIGAALALVVAAMLGGYLVLRRASPDKAGGSSRSAAKSVLAKEALVSLNLGRSADELARAASGENTSDGVIVHIDSPKFESVWFNFDKDHPDHPISFMFAARQGAGYDQRLVDNLSTKLPSKIEGGQWRSFNGLNLDINNETGNLIGRVDTQLALSKEPNERWKQQLDLLFKLVVGTIYELPITPTQDEQRELLGAPHPFASLATIDPLTPTEQAAALTKRFPGSFAVTRAEATLFIALDHPLLPQAKLIWRGGNDGAMTSAFFTNAQLVPSKREAFVDCLGKKLGDPEVIELPGAAKKKTHHFVAGPAHLNVGEGNVSVSSRAQKMSAADWKKVVDALEACR